MRGPVKYRLETSPATLVNPNIVQDENGVSYAAVLHELLRYHMVNALDHQRQAERILDQIETDRWLEP